MNNPKTVTNLMSGACLHVVLAAIALIGCLPAPALAGMRCGSQIINKGTTSAEVADLCGAPTSVDHTVVYVGSGVNNPDNHQVSGSGREIQVEIWTYNFGPDKLMERIRMEDGVVADIQDLGYGYNEP